MARSAYAGPAPRNGRGLARSRRPTPRTSDGKPDLSGFWEIDAGRGYDTNIVAELQPEEVQPWADALYRQRIGDFEKDDAMLRCLPAGPRAFFHGYLAKFVQTPYLVVILYRDLS